MITKTAQKIRMLTLSICLGGLLTLFISGCSMYRHEQPERKELDYGTPPEIFGLTITPNPASPGTTASITVNYVDPNSDLASGLAAVSIDGGRLSSIAFRATYPSGILTLPFVVSHYTRQSDMRV
ncbi:hypothetical protein CSA56_09680, partial [candidate division KSB3 bacterium]